MPSVFNRFLSHESIFGVAEQPAINVDGVMNPLDWANFEKSHVLMFDFL